jgi:hypothetical protein
MGTGTSARPGQTQGDGAQEKAQEIAGQAQEKAQEAASQAKSKLRDQLDQRSSQAAEQINQQASDLRSVSQSLREQGKEGPANAADKLAEYVEKAGGYLRDKDSHALLADAEDFARRQPWAIGAGAFALGLVASRFLKASSGRRYSARYGDQFAAGTRPAVTDPYRPAVVETPTVPMPPAAPVTGAGIPPAAPAGTVPRP